RRDGDLGNCLDRTRDRGDGFGNLDGSEAGALFQVGAGAERAIAEPDEDRRARIRIVANRIRGFGDQFDELSVERVHRVGPSKGERVDAVRALLERARFAHAEASPASRAPVARVAFSYRRSISTVSATCTGLPSPVVSPSET